MEAKNTQNSERPSINPEMVDAPQNAKKTIKRLVALLLEQKAAVVLIALSTLLSIGLFAVTPLIMGWAIDALIDTMRVSGPGAGGGFAELAEIIGVPLILLAAAYLLSACFSFVQEYTMASVGEKLVLSLRQKISEKITKLPLRYYDSHQTGDLLSRTTNDLDRVAEVLKTGLLQFINGTVNIVVSIVVMLSLNVFLTVLILLAMSISVVVTKWISAKNFKVALDNQSALGELNSQIEELYTGNLIIKTYNRQGAVTETVKDISQRQYEANKKAQFVMFAIYPVIRFLTQLGFVMTAIVGGILVVNNTMTIGVVQAFLQYVNQISEPITQASYFLNSLQSAMASAERVFDVLDEEEELPDHPTLQEVPKTEGAVTFENVQFGYLPEKMLMKDVSLSVKPNEMVAIVGPTGAGKTTLVNLLMRFYELNGGRILIDDIDIRELSKSQLRKIVGMVLQDTWLFNGTIAENIAYGKMDATREEIVAAATASRCDHFIRTLPKGYDTVIAGEDGSLSQGEMQLLTIARVMLVNPTLLILDEATSSVDTRTELAIQNAMAQIMEGKTSFVIAHRLSTIKTADMILVMKDGDIIEKGTHEGLLAEETFYRQMYESQFAAAQEVG